MKLSAEYLTDGDDYHPPHRRSGYENDTEQDKVRDFDAGKPDCRSGEKAGEKTRDRGNPTVFAENSFVHVNVQK